MDVTNAVCKHATDLEDILDQLAGQAIRLLCAQGLSNDGIKHSELSRKLKLKNKRIVVPVHTFWRIIELRRK